MTQPLENLEPNSLLQQASHWCIRLAGGEMDAGEQARFEHWLEQSPAHREAFDDAVRAWQGIDELAFQPDMLALRSEALDTLAQLNRKRWAPSRFQLRSLLAVAAAFALLLLSYSLYSHYSFTSYATGTGERRIVMLEDGSRLSLDAETRVDVRYTGDRRELRLESGRARFDVAKDSLRPFTVAAGQRVVVATGTRFSVELLPRRLHVILYEGQVSVVERRSDDARVPQRGDVSSREVQLTSGRELIAATDTGKTTVAPSDPVRTLSWESGILTFEDEPLALAVERINRYGNTKLAVGDAYSAKLLVNGTYTSGDTRAFVEGVTGVLPVRTVRRDGVETFVR